MPQVVTPAAAAALVVASAASFASPQSGRTHELKLAPENVHWGYYDATVKPALRVASGEKVRVELLSADVGASVSFDEVVLVGAGDGVKVGTPLVSGAKVKATVLAHGRGEKVKIFKLRRRKHYQKTQGHRQSYTEVRVDDIVQG